ncbi:hypothetical protein CEP49_00240 [Mergibacter septicus]|uniref:CidA/LrgA family protein n=1 Tax=Mergibacter septicus TaxID=221402 RepID=UPI001178D654|nr:CidA/LrgA family protein [Mergibacter septicus]AWX14591.1 hypothetical protein CEP49_00240 [Mergibacter septicus]
MLRKIIELSRAILIIGGMLYLGDWIRYFLPIGVPASIWGLLLLFIALTLRLIQPQWIAPVALPLMKYMSVLFIPVSVGIINYFDLLVEQAKSLLLPNILSTCITVVITGILAEYLFSRRQFSRLRQKVLKRTKKEKYKQKKQLKNFGEKV